MKKKKSLFISHAANDAPVVKALVDLLESGIGILPEDIYFTSNKGQGIKPGAEFKTSIRDNLDSATTVLALISENYYNSPFCMCELGATWIQAKDFIPILIPPIKLTEMKAVLSGLHATHLESSEDLDELRDELYERLTFKLLPTPRWNDKKKVFLKILPKRLKILPKPPIVDRARLIKMEAIASEYESSLSEAQEKINKQNRLIKKLKKTKDSKETKQIEREELEEVEVFESLAEAALSSLSGLFGITSDVIFSGKCGEDYYPSSASSNYNWDEAQSALQYKEILTNDEENGVCVNYENPHVNTAMESLSDLEQWLESKASEEFYQWYHDEYDGFDPDITDRNFWDTHFK